MKQKPTAKAFGFSLKDQLFNRERVEFLAHCFVSADPKFNAAGFVQDTLQELQRHELKARIVHIAQVLANYLSVDYRVAAKQIQSALPPPLDPTRRDDDFGDFIFAPLGMFVVHHGQSKKHLKLSLLTLKAITQRFSMEDAIRYFINRYPVETLAELAKWSTDTNYHVRRLVSEGTRPLLPWSGRLAIDVTIPLPLLDALHADPTRYVTRSVANHLNDIAKFDPGVVVETLERWKLKGRQDPRELGWMSKHALRTLVKEGDLEALEFLGFATQPKIKVSDFRLESQEVVIGESLEFAFTLSAQRDENVVVDFVIDFVKANGSLSRKVHKLKQLNLKRGEVVTIRKRHALRANATTYTLYPGTHQLTLQINGQLFNKLRFELS